MKERILFAFCIVAATLLCVWFGMGLQPMPTHAQVIPTGRLFNCVIQANTATTIQAVGGDCVAPEASNSLYVIDVNMASTTSSGSAADSMPTLKAVLGNTCTTGSPTIIWLGQNIAASQNVDNSTVPIRVGAGNALCWIDSTAGTKTWVIRGWIGPA